MNPTFVTEMHAELVNLMLFFLMWWKIGYSTGLIVVPFALIGNELWKLGRVKGVDRG